MMRQPSVRIRLLSVPRNREHHLSYPTLVIKVVDADGKEWVTPTLAEAIVHLRSTKGARLVIEDDHLEWCGTPGSTDDRRATYHVNSRLVLDRIDNEFVVQQLAAGPDDRYERGFEWTKDYPPMQRDLSLDPPVRLVGRMREKVVDVDLDLRHPYADRVPDPPVR